MPKVIRPLESDAASGQFNRDMVFSENNGVPVVRAYAVPENPQSAAQTTVRSRLATRASAWATLEEVQRQAWRDYAAEHPQNDPFTGKRQSLSGFNYYVKLNMMAVAAGGEALDEPPADAAPAALATAALHSNAGDLHLDFTATPLGAGCVLDVWIFASASPGRNPGAGDFQHLLFSDAAKASPQVLYADPPAAYYTAMVRVIDQDTGLCSAFLRTAQYDGSAL